MTYGYFDTSGLHSKFCSYLIFFHLQFTSYDPNMKEQQCKNTESQKAKHVAFILASTLLPLVFEHIQLQYVPLEVWLS